MLKQKLPPKVWFHGSQSTIVCTLSCRNGQTCATICWLAQSMRWVLTTPFGIPVDPEVKRILAGESGVNAANASSTAGVGDVSKRSTIGVGVAPTAASAGEYLCGSLTNTRPGCSNSKMYFSFAKSFDISE